MIPICFADRSLRRIGGVIYSGCRTSQTCPLDGEGRYLRYRFRLPRKGGKSFFCLLFLYGPGGPGILKPCFFREWGFVRPVLHFFLWQKERNEAKPAKPNQEFQMFFYKLFCILQIRYSKNQSQLTSFTRA